MTTEKKWDAMAALPADEKPFIMSLLTYKEHNPLVIAFITAYEKDPSSSEFQAAKEAYESYMLACNMEKITIPSGDSTTFSMPFWHDKTTGVIYDSLTPCEVLCSMRGNYRPGMTAMEIYKRLE